MMIERALKLRVALHNLASSDRDLSKYLLLDDEWDCVIEIHKLLQVCNLIIILFKNSFFNFNEHYFII
jgi:hypothetical protein